MKLKDKQMKSRMKLKKYKKKKRFLKKIINNFKKKNKFSSQSYCILTL